MIHGNELSENDYEGGVISSCIKDLHWPTAYARATEVISPKHFSDPNKAKVFEAMGELTEPPDEMILAEKTGVGFTDILGMTDRCETSAHIASFAEGVLKCWSSRQARYIGMELMDGLQQKTDPRLFCLTQAKESRILLRFRAMRLWV